MARYVQPNFIVDSSASFLRNTTFDSSVYLQGVTHINIPDAVSATNPYALVLETGTGTDLEIKSIQLGTMAFEASSNYYYASEVDTLFTAFDSSIITYVDDYNAIQDASISALETAQTETWNGLTTTVDNSVGLGGTLAIDTSIAISTNLFYVGPGNIASGLRIETDRIQMSVDESSQYINNWLGNGIQMYSTSPGTLDYSEIILDQGALSLSFHSQGIISDLSTGLNYGLQYANDYSGDFINESLVTKRYVDNAIGTSVSAWNGLTESVDGSIGLGGILRANTTVDVSNYTLEFSGAAGANTTVNQFSAGRTYIEVYNSGGASSYLDISPTYFDLYSFGNNSSGSDFELYYDGGSGRLDLILNDSSMVVSDSTGKGIQYGGAYESSFIDRSLVTKKYVDDKVGSGVGAWNGLTESDDGSIGLGGTLREATTIDISTYSLTLANLVSGTSRLAIISDAGVLKTQQLGTMALETATDYATLTYVNSNINDVSARVDTNEGEIAQLDASVIRIDAYNAIQDASISANEGEIAQLDASVVRIDAYNAIQDASIATLESATIQTWNGLTTTIDNSVGLGGTLDQNTDIDTTADYYLSVTGDFRVIGDLTVDGSVTYINSVDLNVSDNIITLNYGETGAGVTKTYAGISIDRGTETDYFFGFSEATETFRIGIQDESSLPTNTQAVATREDTPVSEGVAYWNSTANRFDTSVGMTFNSTTGLDLGVPLDVAAGNNTSLNGGLTVGGLSAGTDAYALMVSAATGSVVSTRQLQSPAFTTPANLTETTSNVLTITGGTGAVLNGVTIEVDQADGANDGYLSSTDWTTFNNKISSVNNAPVAATASLLNQNYTSGDVYIKRLIQGTGTTITEDASTITITVEGATGYVSKYTGAFSPGVSPATDSSMTFLAAEHGLSSGGPYSVVVWEQVGTDMEEIYTDVKYNSAGDITLVWTTGSITGDCSVFIAG